MPKLISHRGLFMGPDPELENTEKQIISALQLGYDVETDVRYINGEYWIGHDEPTWKCDIEFLKQPGMWLHAKNLDALYYLSKHNMNCFWHQNDFYTLTLHGYIWAYPGQPVYYPDKTVMVMPEVLDRSLKICSVSKCYAICSDYVSQLAS